MVAIGADEKKKLAILGALGGLVAVAVVVVLNPFKRATPPSATPTATSAGNAVGTPAQPAAPMATGGGTQPAPAKTAVPGKPGAVPARPIVVAPPKMSMPPINPKNFRDDPFVAFYNPPPPPPLPTPTLPPPVEIPKPPSVELPPAMPQPGAIRRPMLDRAAIVGLPPVYISQVNAPVSAFRAPPNPPAPAAPPAKSQNKRLSGVIIGDGVRALLEITEGDEITTRVVQPGDEIEGLRVLRIERYTEGGKTATRMILREGDQERIVELRPSPQPPAAAGAPGGEGGAPGGSGGGRPFGGAPGGGQPFGGRPGGGQPFGGQPFGGAPGGGRAPIVPRQRIFEPPPPP